MSDTIDKRLERVEAELSALKRRVEARELSRTKDWRRTVGMSVNDPEFEEIARLGREYREAQRWENEPDADSGH